VFIERTSVGLDVHARSIVACGLDTATGEVTRRRLVPSSEAVLAWLRELAQAGGGGVRGRAYRVRFRLFRPISPCRTRSCWHATNSSTTLPDKASTSRRSQNSTTTSQHLP
jgi:hypothetical protein